MEDKMFNDILDSIIRNATPDEIELIREKLNQYFINHEYSEHIHKDLIQNPVQTSCPKCGSVKFIRFGRDNKSNQRFRCSDCGKTFSTVTGSLLSYTKKEPYQWYSFIESLLNCESIETSARKAHICERTSFVWRHKILSIFKQLTDDDPMLSDTVYLDETLTNVVHPGTNTNSDEDKMRGISLQKRNIVCAVDIHGNKVIQVSECGRIHADRLIDIYKDKISSKCTVVSDSLRSYHILMKELGVEWIKIPSGKTERDGYTLERINHIHASIKMFLRRFNGFSDNYVSHYIALYKFKDRHKYYYDRWSLINLFRMIVNSSCILKFNNFTKPVTDLNRLYGID